MSVWTSAELSTIGAADELQIASLRPDGAPRKALTIWVVRYGDDLYVRSVNGPTATWFRGVQDRHEGHIQAGGVAKDVAFADADPALNDQLDAAYRGKYRRYARSIVDSIVTPQARAATLKLTPRSTGS